MRQAGELRLPLRRYRARRSAPPVRSAHHPFAARACTILPRAPVEHAPGTGVAAQEGGGAASDTPSRRNRLSTVSPARVVSLRHSSSSCSARASSWLRMSCGVMVSTTMRCGIWSASGKQRGYAEGRRREAAQHQHKARTQSARVARQPASCLLKSKLEFFQRYRPCCADRARCVLVTILVAGLVPWHPTRACERTLELESPSSLHHPPPWQGHRSKGCEYINRTPTRDHRKCTQK